MEKAELEAKLRQGSKKSDRTLLKTTGQVPAIVYGKGIENSKISIDLKKLRKIIGGEAGRNVIISLKISDEGKSKAIPVLTHNIQRYALTGEIIHVDFLRIDMEKEVKTKVHIELVGEPIGVREHDGILIHGFREVEVKCLPADIPDKFEIDVSSLKIGDTFHVSDLKAKKGVEILSSMEETIVYISPPAKEEEIAPPPEVVAAEVPSEMGAPPEGVPPPEEKKAEEEKAPKEEKKAPKEEKKPAEKGPPEKK